VNLSADILAQHLAAAHPGPDTVTALAGLDPAGLSPAGLTDAVQAWHQVVSWATARMYTHAAALARSAGSVQAEMEVSCALKLSAHATDTLLADAAALSGPLADTGAALASGAISPAAAHAITELIDQSGLDPDATVAVQAKALSKAETAPVADVRRTLTRAIDTVDPQAAKRRHADRRERRHVRLYPTGDGMACYCADLEAVPAAKLDATVTDRAKVLKAHDSGLTLDAARADALVDLVAAGHAALTANPGAHPATVETTINITIPAAVLLGLSEEPGELSGHGTITATQVREAAHAAGAVWRRIITDDVTGAVLDVGRTRYRPSAVIADTVRARHPRCVFPTCPRPAASCDLDHREAFGDGGATSVENLGPVCRFHHQAKTHGGWSWTVELSTGDIVWTSPTGHTYTNPAPITV
jgi:hypothetical protein